MSLSCHQVGHGKQTKSKNWKKRLGGPDDDDNEAKSISLCPLEVSFANTPV